MLPKEKSPLQVLGGIAMLGLQVGLYIGLMAYLGKRIDLCMEWNGKWFTLLFVVFATVSSMFYLIKSINKTP